MRLATLMCVGFAGLLAPVAAFAHHAFATEFDATKPVEKQGVVTKVELINPHSWITIEVTTETGEKELWMFEGGSPNALVRRGITKQSVPVGAELIFTGYQARDGSNRAVGRDVTFADGSQLFFGLALGPQERAAQEAAGQGAAE